MIPEVTTLDPVTSRTLPKTILDREGFTCSLLTLAPGEEMPWSEASRVGEHVLFVIDGEATVRFGEVNTMLQKDEALLIAKGRAHSIRAGAGGAARLLRLDIPPRQVITPQILTVDR